MNCYMNRTPPAFPTITSNPSFLNPSLVICTLDDASVGWVLGFRGIYLPLNVALSRLANRVLDAKKGVYIPMFCVRTHIAQQLVWGPCTLHANINN